MKDISPDRSIRNIQVHHRHPQAQRRMEPPEPPRRRRRSSRRLWLVALVVIVIAALLGVLLSALFAGASVTVTPRTAQVSLPASIEAARNAPVGTLSYQEASVSLTATTTVPATGTEHAQKSASGVITIANAYSTASQKLVANTRFQAPDGKIYRIHEAITVPGMQGTQPGTISVTAYADSPGSDYNRSGNTVYTIPGFKGDPRYAKITASSGPMTGGFVGEEPAVAPTDLATAKTNMERQLDTAVRQAFAANLPEGYRLIDGTLSVSFGNLEQTDNGSNTAALSESATASGDVMRTSDLAAAVAKQTVTDYKGEAVTFANPSSVSASASSTPQAGSMQIKLGGGPATLVWLFDPGALQAALVGKPKAQFEAIVKQFEPAIAQADASIRPFWTSTFPSDASKISVTTAEVK